MKRLVKESDDVAAICPHIEKLSIAELIQSVIRKLRASYLPALLKSAFKYRKFGNDSYFDIRTAGNKGIGLFTTIPRKKGDVVFIATGPTRYAHFEGKACFDFPDWYSVDKDIWIDIALPWVKINHSCEPNTAIDGYRCFRAIKNINAGEEITFDYSISDDEDDWGFACLCGTESCCGWVGPIQTITEHRYNLSHPYIPKYFQELYRATYEQ